MTNLPTNFAERRVHWPLLAAVAGLMVIGALFVASATMARPGAEDMAWYRQGWFRQLIWYGLGTGLAAVLMLRDYRHFARWAMVFYWGSILLLGLVLIKGIGTTHGWGARRWIDLGPVQFQPSELAKLSFILAMAEFLSRPAAELRRPGVFWRGLGLALLPFALILKEPDLSSALVFLPVGLVMMFVAGVPVRYLGRLLGAVGLTGFILLADIFWLPENLQFINLQPYQKRRLMVYFGKSFVPPNATEAERIEALRAYRDASYNADQALISVGSGGFWGKGWRQGTQNSLGYLPRGVAHNDFIFSVIAEESGFVGSLLVLGLYGALLFSGLHIAGQARDPLGRLIAVGIVTFFFTHVFINLGMNIRLMPVTGIPLPLLSYGGTSALVTLLAAGLLHNVYSHRNQH
ncbi:MAG: rod shape-determining protein RodA [Verrucomicrobiales bacterium]|nr:rod shape-determining protein RodA [Verrucomicrobiales bacterium]